MCVGVKNEVIHPFSIWLFVFVVVVVICLLQNMISLVLLRTTIPPAIGGDDDDSYSFDTKTIINSFILVE